MVVGVKTQFPGYNQAMAKVPAKTIVDIFLIVLTQLGINVDRSELALEHPIQEQHGDFSTNVALKLFGRLQANGNQDFATPRALAEAIAAQIKQSDLIEKVEVAGPGFINLFLKTNYFVDQLNRIVQEGEDFGRSDWGKGQLWLIEHTSPNPNKAMHLGHLRNNVLGMALGNIWEFMGVSVVRDCIDNNRGIAIAKLMWGYLKFAHRASQDKTKIDYWFAHQDEWLTPDQKGQRPDRFMDELYAKAAEDFKNPEVEKQVRQMVVDWENHEAKNWALWQKVLDYVYEGQQLTLARLGSHWDKVWHEHEHYQRGKDLVQKGLKNGVFHRLGDGAILTDLEKFGLTDTIVEKSDGTALYITQDLALTQLKRDTFHPDKLFWVVGPEQALALKQMFAVCEQLGQGKVTDYGHISYGHMSIKGQGKMSSRLGNVVYIDDLIDTAKAEILAKMDSQRLSGENPEIVSEKVALAAVKYSILKVGRMTNTAFDFETSLTIEGDSGPYLEYTHARCRSVLAQAKELQPISLEGLTFQLEELDLLRWLYRFPEVVLQAGLEYSPNSLAGFLFTLAQRFNVFYNKHSILMAEDEPTRLLRLQLTAATAQILKNGLALLGIEAVNKM